MYLHVKQLWRHLTVQNCYVVKEFNGESIIWMNEFGLLFIDSILGSCFYPIYLRDVCNDKCYNLKLIILTLCMIYNIWLWVHKRSNHLMNQYYLKVLGSRYRNRLIIVSSGYKILQWVVLVCNISNSFSSVVIWMRYHTVLSVGYHKLRNIHKPLTWNILYF